MQASDPAVGLANRVLEREDWARERLSAHAGRSVRIACGPVASTLAITPNGMLIAGSTPPDLTLTVSPVRLPALLAQPDRWNELVTVDGDAALAATLAELARTLPWFIERSFASVLGPVVGTRVADLGRALLSLPEHATRSFNASLVSYTRDEAGIGVDANTLAEFGSDVAAISARVDAAVARLDQARAAHRAKPPSVRRKA